MYTLDYFIAKFTNTRDSKWCVNEFHNGERSCANGWCGIHMIEGKWWATNESVALAKIFKPLANERIFDKHPHYSNIAAHINNGTDSRYQQPTPKKRILAALSDLKLMQQPVRKYPSAISEIMEKFKPYEGVETDVPVKKEVGV